MIRFIGFVISDNFLEHQIMEDRNNVTEFILLELSMDKKVQILCFLFFLFCYLAIWLGNLIIVISITCSQLNTQPMYFFLNCLALSDLFYTSTVTPKLMTDLLMEKRPFPIKTAWHSFSPPTSLGRGEWGLHPHRDGLWLLCGHQQTSPRRHHHEQAKTSLNSHSVVCRGTSSFSWSLSSCDCFTFLWPQWNRPLFLWCISFVETSLHWYTQNWLFCHCQFWLDGTGALCGFDGLLHFDSV